MTAAMRQCGDCTLCCKLLPMKADDQHVISKYPATIAAGLITAHDLDRAIPSFFKAAGARCPHQSHSKGCKVYDRRPCACRFWNCRWLVNDDTDDLSRPDRSHVVLDIMPDFITLVDNNTGEGKNIEVVQVWVDPAHRDAWRVPSIMAYINRLGQDGKAALIRYTSSEGLAVFPPSISSDEQWHEMAQGTVLPERTPAEIAEVVLGP